MQVALKFGISTTSVQYLRSGERGMAMSMDSYPPGMHPQRGLRGDKLRLEFLRRATPLMRVMLRAEKALRDRGDTEESFNQLEAINAKSVPTRNRRHYPRRSESLGRAASESQGAEPVRKAGPVAAVAPPVGHRNANRPPQQGPRRAQLIRDSRFRCYVIDQRKVEHILGELP